MNHKIGLVLCALLGALDLVGIVGLWQHPGPPAAVAVTGAVFGAVTLAAYLPAKHGDARAVRAVLGSRIASALLGVPVFFVDNAPTWSRVLVAAAIAATLIAVTMLLPSARPVPARQV